VNTALPITVITVWRTQKDSHVCPICKALEGYTWTFDAGDYPKQLIHPEYGPVYDTRPIVACSIVNEKEGHQCRCTLEHQFEVTAPTINDNKIAAKNQQSCNI
jgi:hypothetical protein